MMKKLQKKSRKVVRNGGMQFMIVGWVTGESQLQMNSFFWY